jgi:hypothetical protein
MKQLPSAQVPKLRNHILPKGKLLTQVLGKKFGVTLADFDRAMGGDIAAAQKGFRRDTGKLGHVVKFCKLNSQNS